MQTTSKTKDDNNPNILYTLSVSDNYDYLLCYGLLLDKIRELGNKQTTTLVFENKEFNLKAQT